MSVTEALLKAYEEHVQLPWNRNLAGPQRVWFAVYDPSQERRLRQRKREFENATLRAGHNWCLVDITDAFADWMANHEYREAYFERPEDMGLALADFSESVASKVREALTAPGQQRRHVGCGIGLGISVRSGPSFGTHFGGFFRHPRKNVGILSRATRWPCLATTGCQDGWNYHAVPITGRSEGQ